MNDRLIAKLVYRSIHRGCKENDFILGKATDLLKDFTIEELELYDQLLSENDLDIYAWVTRSTVTPEKYIDIINKIISVQCYV